MITAAAGVVPALRPFVRQKTILLTTYRRNGAPFSAPVHVAVDGDRAYVRTWNTTWKLKHIRRNPEVVIAPSTSGGKPTGPSLRARARILEGEESRHAARELARKYPLLHGWLFPLVHRLRGYKTIQIEVRPVNPHEAQS
jgi:uncharacterized protein